VKRKKLLGILLVVVVVAGVVAFVSVRRRGDDDSNTIRVSGNIEVTDAEVSFKLAGRVEKRVVSEGELVKAGQAVALLDRAELAQEVAVRRAETQAAQAALAELEAGSRPEEIAQGEAALELAKAEEKRAAAEFARQKQLFAQNTISIDAFEAAETAHQVAQAKARVAEENLALLKKGPRYERIDQARAQLDQARQALALAETRLGYAALASPLTGVVLSENVESGEFVQAGTPVVTVGDLERPWLRAYVNETDLGRVKVGQPVRVTTDSYPDKHYDGRISFIASEAEFTPKNVQTPKERVKLVYRVKIDIPNPNMELKPGMPADAEILLNKPQ
jgi:HlyD family secretion protein